VSFDLKDETSLVNVFLPIWQLTVPIEDGMKVRVFGLPRIYPRYGKFSLSAERIELAGEGALKKALAALRVRLEAEGLFDPSRKRPLPRFPSRIALVASRESAAYGDFIRILGERWSGLQIDVYHVLVQGTRAPEDIVSALKRAQESAYDVIVMTRGGGSLEELMAFNDERVVRAIHASSIPTLVAIGHERDITLAEEAADVRGSTPTDCARRLVPDRRDVLYEVATMMEGMEMRLQHAVQDKRAVVERALRLPEIWLATVKNELNQKRERCLHAGTAWVEQLRTRLEGYGRLLASLDPSHILSRGYAMLFNAKGHVVSSVGGLVPGELVRARLSDGETELTVGKPSHTQERLF
jgi:exodeoxyribonuclease VII large subunit